LPQSLHNSASYCGENATLRRYVRHRHRRGGAGRRHKAAVQSSANGPVTAAPCPL